MSTAPVRHRPVADASPRAGDLVITYAVAAGLHDSAAREGETVVVRGAYHLDLLEPLVVSFPPVGADGPLAVPGEVRWSSN